MIECAFGHQRLSPDDQVDQRVPCLSLGKIAVQGDLDGDTEVCKDDLLIWHGVYLQCDDRLSFIVYDYVAILMIELPIT